jgi:ketosteroid isomerase-like protein
MPFYTTVALPARDAMDITHRLNFKTQTPVMKKILRYPFILLLLIPVCAGAQTKRETAIKEIKAAEKAFNDMAGSKGIKEAFVFFADKEVVIKRGKDSLIHGIEGVGHFYSGDFFRTATVTWAPDFTDASESGDLGYTYGKYEWLVKDAAGNTQEKATGIFHTVWKKQPDGSWKYVWD